MIKIDNLVCSFKACYVG